MSGWEEERKRFLEDRGKDIKVMEKMKIRGKEVGVEGQRNAK